MLAILRRLLLSPLFRLVWTMLLVLALAGGLRLVAPRFAAQSNISLEGALRNAALFLVAVAVSVRLLEGRRLRDVGLRAGAALPDGLRGFAVGAGLLTATIGALAVTGQYQILGWEPLPPGISRSSAFLESLVILLGAATFEELWARGIFFRLFEQALGTWLAIALSAGLFALGHRGNPGATTMSALGVAQAGVLLAAAYAATRSLWFPIGLHWAWNLFEGPVWGSPVSGIRLNVLTDAAFPGSELWSGGSFGLERGLALGIPGTVLSVAFLVLAVRRGEIRIPGWMRWLMEQFRTAPALLEPVPTPGASEPEPSV